MGEKEISINFSELNRIEVYCPKCRVGILLDISSSKYFPATCSACGEKLPNDACTALLHYNEFFKNASLSKVTFQFRVKAS